MPSRAPFLVATAAALAAVAPAALAGTSPRAPSASVRSATLLRVDVSGDGVADAVRRQGPWLVVDVRNLTVAAPVPGRVDGAIALRGMRGALLMVRSLSSRDGFVDALYRVRGAHLERVHVVGIRADGIVTALVGSTYVDVDCGAAPRTVAQVALQPLGGRWRRTIVTFALRGDRLLFVGRQRAVVSGAEASRRRCAVARR